MRRAAAKALRTTLQCTVWGFRTTATLSRRGNSLLPPPPSLCAGCWRPSSATSSHSTSRFLSTTSPAHSGRSRSDAPSFGAAPLKASMYNRRALLAVVSGLVGYGAYQYAASPSDSFTKSAGNHASSTGEAASAVPTRQVLVIGADELRMGTIVGDGPISKTTSEDGRRVIEMLNPEQVTEKLRKNEESFFINRGRGVVRWDLTQLPSNDPIEDDHDEKIFQMQGEDKSPSDWMFWGVFDGHSGWTTSAKLRQALVTSVATELNATYKASKDFLPPPEAVETAMKTGFLKLDHEIVHQSVQNVLQANNKAAAAQMLAPALSGSCALLSFYDSRSKLLRVACTGDSRAVLGRRTESGRWTATPLSTDQTGSNPDEADRLRALHPGEPNVVRHGRVLGQLEPTRAFGDASYKWAREISEKLRAQFFARSPSPHLKTPPYVTAEPVVTTTQIQPEKGDFLVLATDGLWEMLTNEEVVGLVGKWIESQANGGPSPSSTSQFNSVWARIFGSRQPASELPIEAGAAAGADGGQKTPRQRGASDGFVVRDANVATHLVRNALGGKNEEQVSALLTLPSPFSRRYRDDLTVQVIFFGDGAEGKTVEGQVVVNKEATGTAAQPLKAKL